MSYSFVLQIDLGNRVSLVSNDLVETKPCFASVVRSTDKHDFCRIPDKLGKHYLGEVGCGRYTQLCYTPTTGISMVWEVTNIP